MFLPRVEALHASTLGYEIATPTELPGVRPVHHRHHPNLPHGEGKSPNEGPIPAFPKGKVCATTSSNTRRTNSRPLGRVREGLTISYFFTANGGLFLRPKAAF